MRNLLVASLVASSLLTAACTNAGTIPVQLSFSLRNVTISSVSGAVCSGVVRDFEAGKRHDLPHRRVNDKERAAWVNPLTPAELTNAFVIAGVCQYQGLAGWQAAAPFADDFTTLAAYPGRVGPVTLHSFVTRTRSPGAECEGELRDVDHRLIQRFRRQVQRAPGVASWYAKLSGKQGYGWVVCRRGGLIDIDVFTFERDRVTLAARQ